MILVGYHGTEKKNKDIIIKNGYKKSSKKEWLGEGIYLFETLRKISDGYREAKNWVIYVKKKKEWAVIKTTIESRHFVDLVENVGHRNLYDKIKKAAIEIHKKSGKKVSDFLERTIYIKLEEENFDFIRTIVDSQRDYSYNG